MSKRLGEVLIERGVIDADQLKVALDAQMIYGGHLGTCLVELGFVDVQTLGDTLAAGFRVSHASRELIDSIPAHVISLLPRKLVERHMAIPFEVRERTLRVAMVNPCDLQSLDELSFATGYKIEAWIAPEILIVRAMEHYYDIGRKLRHIPLSIKPGFAHESRPAPPAPAVAAPAPAAPTNHPQAEQGRPVAAPTASRAAPVVATMEAPSQPETIKPRPAPLELPLQPEAMDLPLQPEAPRGVFIPQALPRYSQEQPARSTALNLAWIKFKEGGTEPESWCDPFQVDLTHEHFVDLEGVYVVWHHDQNPVLLVGQGEIRRAIRAMRDNQQLIDIARESKLFVTWADVPSSLRNGVERYLIEMLSPRDSVSVPSEDPIAVNLPR